jgi:hypothetical protein
MFVDETERNHLVRFIGCMANSKEAAAVLIEVDRALRSTNIGTQCEAILQCGQLLESSDTIVLNTTLLKLADHFRLRYYELKRCKIVVI